MVNPVVSVIIPSYNHSDFLSLRLRTVLEQTFQDYEVLLLDDCSTDGSPAILESYRNHPKVTDVIVNPVNSGSTFHQWEKGIAASTGKIIWIAESDDYSELDFLASLVPAFAASERTGVAYCQSYRANVRNEVSGTWKDHTDDLNSDLFTEDFTMEGKLYIDRFLIHKNTIPNASAVLFKRDFYEKTGGMDTGVKYCSDWLTWLKILTNSDLFFYSRPLNYFRYHHNSVIANATRSFDYSKYVEKYDRSMRLKYQDFLQRSSLEATGIFHQNTDYIEQENKEEALFVSGNV